jgi:AGZA family xanthine/uracil permease-like MFS transporter
MAYIMFVNPAILEKAGMDHGVVFVVTRLAAAASTAIMGLYANYPIALAPGMGLNAYMATSLGAIAWDEPTEYIPALIVALMIPLSYSIATGIGLGFIAYMALKLLTGRLHELNAASASLPGHSCPS